MKYDFERIKFLVENETPESKTLDFKQEWKNPKPNDDKFEFLKDITAMANTDGGTIVYGIGEGENENKGKANSLIGVTIEENEANFRQRIHNIIETNTDPKLINIQIDLVYGENNKNFVVINIPQSWNAPHRITLNKNPFYKRNSEDNKPMDTFQLRSEFVFSQKVDNAIKDFHDKRITGILSGDTPIPIDSKRPAVVLHIIPRISMMQGVKFGNRLDIDLQNFSPIPYTHTHNNQRYNIDGYLKYSSSGEPELAWSYAQFYRIGIIETVYNLCFEEDPSICNPFKLEETIYPSLLKYLHVLDNLGVQRPFIIYLSFINVENFKLNIANVRSASTMQNHALTKSVLLIPNFLLQELDKEKQIQEAEDQITIAFNQIWNAFGHPYSYTFDYEAKNRYKKQLGLA